MISVPDERPIPDEIPWREIEHQEPHERDDVEGRDYIGSIGAIREREWWGEPPEHEEEQVERRRIEQRRREIGGFGFRIERA